MRNGLFSEEAERGPARKRRTVGIAISLVLHALLVYGVYYARVTLKILSIPSEVRNVYLAPPIRMIVPSPLDQYLQRPAGGDLFGMKQEENPPARPGRAGQSGNPARPLPPGGARDETVLAPENLMKTAPGEKPGPETGLANELALGKRYQAPGTAGYVINLSALPDHVEDAPLGFEGGPNQRYRPLQKYSLPNRPGLGIGPGTARGGSPGGQRARVVIRSPGYDISPWAQKAVDMIQVNWKIPESVRILSRSEVRIAVTIEKNGRLSSFKVQASTDLEVLNAAAEAALNSGLPLPPLPEDFPRPNLEAIFVFEYDD